MRCGIGIEARQVNELFINIDPIQAGEGSLLMQ